MKRVYHGWIYIAKEPGFRDGFHVVWGNGDDRQEKFMGKGARGAAESVEFFDALVGQRVKLQPYGVLGLRVYTEEELATIEEPDIVETMRRLSDAERIDDAEAYEQAAGTYDPHEEE